ncbi:hypothetical protein SDC9_09870 [bioreactor metagenome]|uniref:Uncharacterized protein n=2 Tax=root TaxID=1 RepID=A0A098AX08_DESHA|nr:Hypothetical protein DPCES_1287 [Desulfitobacterium hafniense]
MPFEVKLPAKQPIAIADLLEGNYKSSEQTFTDIRC